MGKPSLILYLHVVCRGESPSTGQPSGHSEDASCQSEARWSNKLIRLLELKGYSLPTVVDMVNAIDPDARVTMSIQDPHSREWHAFLFPGSLEGPKLETRLAEKFGAVGEDVDPGMPPVSEGPSGW